MNKLHIPLLCILTTVISMPAVTITPAMIQWSGHTLPDADNQDVVILGDCIFDDNMEVTISATTRDVTVYMNDDALIRANPESEDGQSYIYLRAFYPYTITFIVDHHLRFEGTELDKTQPLTIWAYVEDGEFSPGTIRWEIEECGKLEFTASENSGGTEVIIEYNPDPDQAPTMYFSLTKENQLHFGERSGLGYFAYYDCGNTFKAETVFEYIKDDCDDDDDRYDHAHYHGNHSYCEDCDDEDNDDDDDEEDDDDDRHHRETQIVFGDLGGFALEIGD